LVKIEYRPEHTEVAFCIPGRIEGLTSLCSELRISGGSQQEAA